MSDALGEDLILGREKEAKGLPYERARPASAVQGRPRTRRAEVNAPSSYRARRAGRRDQVLIASKTNKARPRGRAVFVSELLPALQRRNTGLLMLNSNIHTVTDFVQQVPETVGDHQQSHDIIKRGQIALSRLERNCWSDWCDVSLALDAGRSHAFREARSNNPKSKAYQKAMCAWLRCQDFDRIDRGDRCRLLEVADNLIAINAWRAKQPEKIQVKLNYPSVVLRAWRRSLHKKSEPESENKSEQKLQPRLDQVKSADVLLAGIPDSVRAELEDRVVGQLSQAKLSEVESKRKSRFAETLTKLWYRALREPDQHKRAESFEFLVNKLRGRKYAPEDFIIKEVKPRR
jgi:hypothetical protein